MRKTISGSPVSVVIPAYNRCGILPRAIRSVLNQTFLPGEIIVIDDGSTDQTAETVRNEFPGVCLVSQAQQGVSTARNHGVNMARLPWIAFLDSDDQWLPRKLEKQLSAISATGQPLVCHTNEIWVRDGRRVNPMDKHRKHGGRVFPECLERCMMSPSSILIKKKLLLDLGGFDESFPACEDYDLWLRLTADNPVAYIETPLIIKYGGHEDQLSGQYWGMDRFRIRALENILGQPALRADYRRLAIRTLHRKIGIYINGARKRGRHDEVTRYERKLADYPAA